eukprot:TRINITY_DN40061_c0_g1_i1.p1 TRINITY_DN40061_c0_g1~~TRINITY_DN40061_c0_g1_i1.p1  ORF type:complete len:371 (+),score=-2.19 TRINITY_DN40061_c0_g1_i1:140-1114(+)
MRIAHYIVLTMMCMCIHILLNQYSNSKHAQPHLLLLFRINRKFQHWLHTSKQKSIQPKHTNFYQYKFQKVFIIVYEINQAEKNTTFTQFYSYQYYIFFIFSQQFQQFQITNVSNFSTFLNFAKCFKKASNFILRFKISQNLQKRAIFHRFKISQNLILYLCINLQQFMQILQQQQEKNKTNFNQYLALCFQKRYKLISFIYYLNMFFCIFLTIANCQIPNLRRFFPDIKQITQTRQNSTDNQYFNSGKQTQHILCNASLIPIDTTYQKKQQLCLLFVQKNQKKTTIIQQKQKYLVDIFNAYINQFSISPPQFEKYIQQISMQTN